MGKGRRLLLPASLLLAALALAGSLRLLEVSDQEGSTLVWLWAWQECRVDFVNSVTGRPVTISFSAPWRLSGFRAVADAGSEEYYTGGQYAWNRRLATEQRQRLQYCSEVGLRLTLGREVFLARGGCLSVSLQWPP